MQRLSVQILHWWRRLSLVARFAIAAGAVVGGVMLVLGTWVSNKIEQGVVQNTAKGAALLVETLIEPHVRELRDNKRLSDGSMHSLDTVLMGAVGQSMLGVRVWGPGGYLAYSDNKSAIGSESPESLSLRRAWAGKPVGQFENDEAGHHSPKAPRGGPVLAIYAPIFDQMRARVIAVAEFYEEATALETDLRNSRIQSWIVVGALALTMLSLLLGIVRQASQRMIAQEGTLQDRIDDLSRLLRQNEDLRRDVADLHRRSIDRNEQFLRRVGAELHDGPAQMIGLALLRLDALVPRIAAAPAVPATARGLKTRPDELETIRAVLNESLTEIRNISAGLALPAIDRMTPAAALTLVADAHERRTGTIVDRDLDGLPLELPHELKTCLYRFVQEGLNNAYHHAQGAGQFVRGKAEAGYLEIRVRDAGPGIVAEGGSTHTPEGGFTRGLGLVGLRDRVVALGGAFEIQSGAGAGTAIVARFKLERPGAGAG